ncbi:MAG: DUF805 domain-containing protein [Planctomycetia bacterium]|nr:DUF805 domain-containing protein [Planctomycetia bacterium]
MRRFIQAGKVHKTSEISTDGRNWQRGEKFLSQFTAETVVPPVVTIDYDNPYAPPNTEELLPVAGQGPMTLWGSYWNGWYRCFSVSGRATRTEYSIFTFCNSILLWVVWLDEEIMDWLAPWLAGNTLLLIGLVVLGTAWITLSVRRLHDMNTSGLWLVAVVWIPWIMVFFLGIRAGTTGPNRFGPDPR